MTKTNKVVTIVERTHRGTLASIDRRLYENENGIYCVRINKCWFTLDDVKNFSTFHKMNIWVG